jgi:Lon protease-like protein
MDEVLPIFPLSHVLLPGMALPLHIFEPRYRQMLSDVTAPGGSHRFGLVMLTRGIEIGTWNVLGEPEFADIGTVAQILEVHPYENGSSDLYLGGCERFRVLRRLDGGPAYLRAEVEYVPEVDGELTPALTEVAVRLAAEHARLVTALTGRAEDEPPPDDPALLSYHLIHTTPLTPRDRQLLLAEPTTADRFRSLIVLLRREIPLLRQTRTIAVAPQTVQLYLRPN